MKIDFIEELLLQEMEEVKGGAGGTCICATEAAGQGKDGTCICAKQAAQQQAIIKPVDPTPLECVCATEGAASIKA